MLLLNTTSVMEKLPPTSYIRMVDIWLIWAQLIPFIEVVVMTMIELYIDDEDEDKNESILVKRVIPKDNSQQV